MGNAEADRLAVLASRLRSQESEVVKHYGVWVLPEPSCTKDELDLHVFLFLKFLTSLTNKAFILWTTPGSRLYYISFVREWSHEIKWKLLVFARRQGNFFTRRKTEHCGEGHLMDLCYAV